MSAPSPRQSPLVSALALAALVGVVATYFVPVWWVSLTAPNYPADAFPDGIRIHFGFQGVSNGCTTPPKTSRISQETLQEDLGWRDESGGVEKSDPKARPDLALDCLHEMNTINHYVGMHPIGVGAPAERLLSRYILALFAVALLGLAIGAHKPRVVAMGAGFAGISGWMVYDLWGAGGLARHVAEYTEEAGKYFREAERIAQWGQTLSSTVTGLVVGLIVLMAVVTLATWRWPRFQLVLGLVPALLPVFFVGAFAAWLYFFGHNLHPWGAFTVKPFMPTVFGDGKVAQFSTHSYPLPGFTVMVVVSVLSLVAVLRRRLEFLDARAPAPAVAPPPAAPGAGAGVAGTPAAEGSK